MSSPTRHDVSVATVSEAQTQTPSKRAEPLRRPLIRNEHGEWVEVVKPHMVPHSALYSSPPRSRSAQADRTTMTVSHASTGTHVPVYYEYPHPYYGGPGGGLYHGPPPVGSPYSAVSRVHHPHYSQWWHDWQRRHHQGLAPAVAVGGPPLGAYHRYYAPSPTDPFAFHEVVAGPPPEPEKEKEAASPSDTALAQSVSKAFVRHWEVHVGNQLRTFEAGAGSAMDALVAKVDALEQSMAHSQAAMRSLRKECETSNALHRVFVSAHCDDGSLPQGAPSPQRRALTPQLSPSALPRAMSPNVLRAAAIIQEQLGGLYQYPHDTEHT